MKNVRLQIPTPQLVTEYVSRFDRDDRYGLADRVLLRVFGQYPDNTDLESVLAKVVLLNRLYNTNVFAVVDMAKHICSLRIDAELRTGSPALVDRIAKLTIRGRTRRHYSFATKYCSWHAPAQFPIYDTLVDTLLWAFRCQYHFAEFQRQDLRLYPGYKNIIASFQKRYGLEHFTFKEMDKFLWFYGKELYSRTGAA